MQRHKQSGEAVAGDVLVGLSGFAPAMLLALGLRAATRMPQRSVNTVTTNVPGPQHPLYAAGRRMLEALPYVPIAGHVRIGVAIFSYDGALSFGITGDYDKAADIDLLGRGIERSMGELVLAAEREAERAREASSPRVRARSRRQPSGSRSANGGVSRS
jgi:diacylglycerol O-acyltransferase